MCDLDAEAAAAAFVELSRLYEFLDFNGGTGSRWQ